MKIVYVYPQFANAAGTERILIDKMNYLAEQIGYEIIMLTYEQSNNPIAFELSPKVRHVDLDVRYYPLYRYPTLIRLLKWQWMERRLQRRYNEFMAQERPDIVVAVTYYASLLGLIDKCPTPSVRLLESHIDRRFILSNDPVNKRTLHRWLHMRYHMHLLVKRARHFDHLVALSPHDAADWSQFLPTSIITNTVHLNQTGRHSSLDNKRVIFAGRYMEQKGIPDLFKAWTLVHAKHPDWQLHLYGDGELRDTITQEAHQLQANIHVHQPETNIFSHYLESDIFALASLYEPFGLVMPEAMSCGLPVVAFDCPSGPASIITNGYDGYLVPDRDIELFASRLCQLIEDRELRQRMGQQAINSAQRFAPEQVMSQWVALFEQLSRQK